MDTGIDREAAWRLLKQYNEKDFHIQHAITVEKVMGYFAQKHGEDVNFWSIAGLLHDIDYEKYPDAHCQKAKDILKESGATEDLIHAVVSHGYGVCSEVEPTHLMEKTMYAVDELTGLIGAAALMRPSKSVQDMKLKSIKKKFKDKAFAAGCSRDTIKKGAEILGMNIDDLLWETVLAMKAVEKDIETEMERYRKETGNE
ncbi:MAG: HDIG domain-containing protein [Eubacteriaceae bacterium]|jgi:putative nucleotidyltransferase with HDIG domain|nr:HDIG domain-containing protein [Eubacteriaceae bacterium]